MKQKLLKMFVLVLLTVNAAFAQNRTITGKVSGEHGSPIQGVSVKPLAQMGGAMTDANGNYSLVMGPDVTTLEFAFVGYNTKRVAIGAFKHH